MATAEGFSPAARTISDGWPPPPPDPPPRPRPPVPPSTVPPPLPLPDPPESVVGPQDRATTTNAAAPSETIVRIPTPRLCRDGAHAFRLAVGTARQPSACARKPFHGLVPPRSRPQAAARAAQVAHGGPVDQVRRLRRDRLQGRRRK